MGLENVAARLVVAEQHAMNAVTHVDVALAARQDALDCFRLTREARNRYVVDIAPEQQVHVDRSWASAKAAEDDLDAAADALEGVGYRPKAIGALDDAHGVAVRLQAQAKGLDGILRHAEVRTKPQTWNVRGRTAEIYSALPSIGVEGLTANLAKDGWRRLRVSGLTSDARIGRDFRRDELMQLSTLDATGREQTGIGQVISQHVLEDAARQREALARFLEQAEARPALT